MKIVYNKGNVTNNLINLNMTENFSLKPLVGLSDVDCQTARLPDCQTDRLTD